MNGQEGNGAPYQSMPDHGQGRPDYDPLALPELTANDTRMLIDTGRLYNPGELLHPPPAPMPQYPLVPARPLARLHRHTQPQAQGRLPMQLQALPRPSIMEHTQMELEGHPPIQAQDIHYDAVDDNGAKFRYMDRMVEDLLVNGGPDVVAQMAARGCGPLIETQIAAPQFSDGCLRVILADGLIVHAIRFRDAYNEGTLLSAEASQPDHQQWTSQRNAGRPDILYQIGPDGGWVSRYRDTYHLRPLKASEYLYRTCLDTRGRVLLGSALRPMRYIHHFPSMFDAKVEGWYLEALFRIDPFFSMSDVCERIPNSEDEVSSVSLAMLRTQARRKMRILQWPIFQNLFGEYWDGFHPDTDRRESGPIVWDVMVLKELNSDDYNQNSTRHLADIDTENVNISTHIRSLQRTALTPDAIRLILAYTAQDNRPLPGYTQ